jgi:hypothetical protein
MAAGGIIRRIGAFAAVITAASALGATPVGAQSYERARLSWTPPSVDLSLIVLDGTTANANRASPEDPGGIPGATLAREASGDLVFTESEATSRAFQYVVCNKSFPLREDDGSSSFPTTDQRYADFALRLTGPPGSADARTLRRDDLPGQSGVALGSSPPGQPQWIVGDACEVVPPPVLGSSTAVVPTGRVSVRSGPGGDREPIADTGSLGVGSEVNATRGSVELTAAFSIDGLVTRSGVFGGASFILRQASTAGAPVNLRVDKPRGACSRRGYNSTFSSDSQRGFRVYGALSFSQAATASVRARSQWETIERCTGTETVVHSGRVSVYDRKLRRRVKLLAGERYLARRGNR